MVKEEKQKALEAALAQNNLCVIGSEAAIQKEKELFGAIGRL